MNMEPTNLDIFLSEVKKTGETKLTGIYHQVPFRMFSPHYQRVEGLRNYMNEPRNKVLNSLIEIALDQVFENLSKDEEVYKAVMAEVYKINIVESFDGSGDLTND
ncbi:MAG: hypothetical protein L0G09_14410 [Acinetobacter sp.]|nr:hypothetical protein [Acinetobacter sp.]